MTTHIRKFTAALLLSAASATSIAFADDQGEAQMPPPELETGYTVAENNIVESVAATDTLGHFTLALGHTGIADILVAPGPYTVFAPLDTAFEALDPLEFERLMTDEDTTDLSRIIKAHIIPGKIDSYKLTEKITSSENGRYDITTLNGVKLKAFIEHDQVVIVDSAGNGVKVVTPDIKQTNGIVHIVDGLWSGSMSDSEPSG